MREWGSQVKVLSGVESQVKVTRGVGVTGQGHEMTLGHR